jgi:hypothetical protein
VQLRVPSAERDRHTFDMSAEQEIKGVLDIYFDALKTNDGPKFHEAFDRQSTVTHANLTDGTASTVSIDEFVEQVKGFHAELSAVVETPTNIVIDLAEPIASARVDFTLQLGENEVTGTDFFNLAKVDGRWSIQHKIYFL